MTTPVRPKGVINFSTFVSNVAGDQGGAVSAQGGYSMTNVTVTGTLPITVGPF